MRILSLILLATLFAGVVYGSNIDYLTNRSVSYIRNFARNAATEGADLVTYNPAGLVFLVDPADGEGGSSLYGAYDYFYGELGLPAVVARTAESPPLT